MEDTTENNAGQANVSAETTAVSLGKMLSEARERLGLTVMDVAGQIKFAPKQIEALEADDYRHLPEPAFLRGFVRSYAKILHLDAQTVLAALPQKQATHAGLLAESAGEPFPIAHAAQRQNLVWLGATLLLIAIVVGFAWWHFTTPVETKTTQTESPVILPDDLQVNPNALLPDSAVIEPAKPKTQPPAPATKQAAPRSAQPGKTTTSGTASGASLPMATLRLEFNEDSWAEIKDKDGKILSSRAHLGGSELKIDGHPPLSVLIGHASSVHLYYRDKEVDLVPHTRRSTDVAHVTLE